MRKLFHKRYGFQKGPQKEKDLKNRSLFLTTHLLPHTKSASKVKLLEGSNNSGNLSQVMKDHIKTVPFADHASENEVGIHLPIIRLS